MAPAHAAEQLWSALLQGGSGGGGGSGGVGGSSGSGSMSVVAGGEREWHALRVSQGETVTPILQKYTTIVSFKVHIFRSTAVAYVEVHVQQQHACIRVVIPLVVMGRVPPAALVAV
jgi:hypothetical protein